MPNCYNDLSDFQKQYIRTLIWSSGEIGYEEQSDPVYYNLGPLNGLVTASEIDLTDSDTARHMESVQDFYQRYKSIWLGYWETEGAAHDLALTRNGHGTGFWDRFYTPYKRIPSFTCVGTVSSLIPTVPRAGVMFPIEGRVRGALLTKAAKLEGSCWVCPIACDPDLGAAELQKLVVKGSKVFNKFVII